MTPQEKDKLQKIINEVKEKEEKAREICGCNNCYHNLKENECLKDNRILCCLKPCLKNALEAMEWKDEQHAKEKQQWIEKAWNWLTEQKGERTIDDFKKAMGE